MKNKSVMTYIMTIWFISEIIMFSLTVFFMHSYINQSVELDIRSSLSRQITSLSEKIISRHGSISINEKQIEKKYPDMYIAIIDGEGNILWGTVPDNVEIDTKRSFAPSKITLRKNTYYYIDRDIRYTMLKNNFVRAYVNENDILENYIFIRIICYGGIIVVFAILTIIMLYALKRFRHSVKMMETSVEKIGTSQFSERHTEESGHYREINSLIRANNRMLDRMQEIFNQQEQFSSDVAHELKTPIAVIMAQSQYALNHMKLSDDVKESFNVILKQAQNMQGLVTALMTLSRLESDDKVNMQEIIDLPEIVTAVCEAQQYGYSNCHAEFSIINNCTSETTGNIDLVTIAVTNLVSNAIKYNKNNAVIEAETGEQDNFVFVRIKDYGIGMTEEEQKKIFTRFYRSDSSRSSSGYGLGMPIALKIAKKHGGSIQIESEVGKGSCFTLYLSKN